MPLSENDPRIRDSVVYWFVTLEESRRRGHFRRAEQAQRELKRLGVAVTFIRPESRRMKHGSRQ